MNKAKKQAIYDIKQELEMEGKCFISFIEELNPFMRKLVREQIKQQNKKSKKPEKFKAYCLTYFGKHCEEQ